MEKIQFICGSELVNGQLFECNITVNFSLNDNVESVECQYQIKKDADDEPEQISKTFNYDGLIITMLNDIIMAGGCSFKCTAVEVIKQELNIQIQNSCFAEVYFESV